MTKIFRGILEQAPETDKQRYARVFHHWVLSCGMSRKEPADYLGTSTSRLSTYENGTVTPSGIISEKVRLLTVHER